MEWTGSVAATPPSALSESCPQLIDAGWRALYLGPSFALDTHRNSVAVVALALAEPFTLEPGRDAKLPAWRGSAALIPPGRWHRLTSTGPMAFLYLDPNDRGWRTLAARSAQATADLATGLPNAARLPALLRALRADPTERIWSDLTDALGLPAPEPDPRLRATLAALHADPGGAHPVDAAAAAAGYSITAFQRRFTSSAGLPWRRYRLWLRIRHAVRLASCGTSLTDAAHAAGFASSAHFSSSFKAMFGLPPAQLIGAGVHWRVLKPADPATL